MGKGSGWHNESRRHSLASRGIKTVSRGLFARGLFGQSYYDQLAPIVLGYLEAYEKDFTEYDQKNMMKYDEFILAMRKTGTDFLPFAFFEDMTPEYRLALVEWIKRDDRFFYAHDGVVEEISKEKAEKLYTDYARESEKLRKFPIREFPVADLADVRKYAGYEVWERQNYGLRNESVKPKMRYTKLWWSNAGERWYAREEVFHEDTARLDANEILLPYRKDQVQEILGDLPPLPLFELSHEAKMRYASKSAMPREMMDDITDRWAYKQAMRKFQEGSLGELFK